MLNVSGRKFRIAAEMIRTLSHDPVSVRFVRPWIRSLRPDWSPLYGHLPWMNFKVIRWLQAMLRPSMTAFEYGPGGSTIFLAKRIRSVTSVEHDKTYYDEVSEALRHTGFSNCDLRLIPPDVRPDLKDVPAGPHTYTSSSPAYAGYSFEAYVRAIDRFPDGSLDLVIVDGYARLACALHAVPKIRPGGYLLFDDTDWRKYRDAFRLLADFPRTDFIGVTPWQKNLRQTTVWRMSGSRRLDNLGSAR